MKKVRISCASLASISIDNKYLLCVNKSQFKRGKKVYTPFGGALEYDKKAIPFLKNLNVDFERTTPDLRLVINEDLVGLFDVWFTKQIDREVGINRELIEELVEEENIFDDLTENDFTSEYIKLDKVIYESKGVKSYMFFEIYSIIFNDDKVSQLLKNSDKIRLISKEEILKSVTNDGISIGSNSKSIIIQ